MKAILNFGWGVVISILPVTAMILLGGLQAKGGLGILFVSAYCGGFGFGFLTPLWWRTVRRLGREWTWEIPWG